MQFFRFAILRICRLRTVQRARYAWGYIFGKHQLLAANISVSVAMSGLGDVIEQHIEIFHGNLKALDGVRTRNMSIAGFTGGFVVHYSYKYLDILYPERTLKIILKKVVIDQVLTAPVCIVVFFGTLALLEKEDWATLRVELHQKGIRLFLAELFLWPPAQILNFYVVPPEFRVFYDNLVSLGFDIYTSYIKHSLPLQKDSK